MQPAALQNAQGGRLSPHNEDGSSTCWWSLTRNIPESHSPKFSAFFSEARTFPDSSTITMSSSWPNFAYEWGPHSSLLRSSLHIQWTVFIEVIFSQFPLCSTALGIFLFFYLPSYWSSCLLVNTTALEFSSCPAAPQFSGKDLALSQKGEVIDSFLNGPANATTLDTVNSFLAGW